MESASYSDMICAFLDGELDISSEESLFAALAAAPDLRTEMREYLSIRSAVQSHTEAFTPPAESALAVFGGVGLDYPAIPPPRDKARKIGVFWSNFGLIATFSVLFSLATWGVVSYWYENKLSEFTLYGRNISAAHSVTALQSASIADFTALRTTTKLVTNTSHMAGNGANVFSTDSFSSIASPILAVFDTENGGNTTSPSEISATTIVDARPVSSAAITYSAPQIIQSDTFSPASVYPQFWMQARGIATITSSPAPLSNVGISPFDNAAVSGYYKLSSAFSIGAEIGREYYALQYTGKSESTDIIYRQVVPLLFGGLTAQYSLEPQESFGDITTYLALSGGGTEIGQYVRATLGIYYPLSSSFGMTLGGDLSSLFFQFQGRSFQSWKSGLTYGFAFQF